MDFLLLSSSEFCRSNVNHLHKKIYVEHRRVQWPQKCIDQIWRSSYCSCRWV
uniref:Uncharacterized protein n=1 Tax=uncultured bacterium A1Q1_fos_291 TaxID=1256570 RepID=L7VWV0_9BACT|nr:hypothetical protein [uncultured bacterium A1Q1_fos_291]